jgi:hypothetical protein
MERALKMVYPEHCSDYRLRGYFEEARGMEFAADKKQLVKKLRPNPLNRLFRLLAEFLVTPSAEATDLMRPKARSASSSPKNHKTQECR